MATSLANQAILFLFLSLFTISVSTIPPLLQDDYDKCVYTLYIRTSKIWKGGTDSIIGVDLRGTDGKGFYIPDLEAWGGLMGTGHDYYERGNLDVFSGLGPCLSSWPCWMNLTSDGSGPGHGWYCNYVEVTSTGPHMGCNQLQFKVEQWLARDAPPYQLYAVRDYCKPSSFSGEEEGQGVRLGAGEQLEKVMVK